MPKRVVILGGGFAGVSAAQELTKRLRKQHRLSRPKAPIEDGVEVLLISRDNYFVFQPLLADIISGTIETTHVVVPLRRMLPHAQVEVGYVETIDVAARTIRLRRRVSGAVASISYDALIVALGSVTDLRAVPGMAEHAVGIRTLGDAFYLRNRALEMLEEARIESDGARREQLLTFVVVGGGSTGVEVAAELRDLVELAARSFRESDPLSPLIEPRVILVQGGPELLPSLGSRLARYTEKKLRERHVELVMGHRLTRVAVDHVQLDDGSTIPTATVV